MVLPNLAFDALLFGLLFLAAIVDGAFPILHGTASLLIVGGATYWAAQELSEALLRRVGWSQESLATSVSLCAGGFLYFVLRNSSDLSLLALSIGLMMGALMSAISILAAASGTLKEGRTIPLMGWLATAFTSLALGIAAGGLALSLGSLSNALLPFKIGALAIAFILWKVREKVAAPPLNTHYQEATAQTVAPAPLTTTSRPAPFPQRGTLLDRLFPLLVIGVLLGALTHDRAQLSPYAAAPSDNGEAR